MVVIVSHGAKDVHQVSVTVDNSHLSAAYRGGMRWDALFADMELQLDAAEARERAAQVADLTRAERASVRLADRLRAGTGGPVRLALRNDVGVDGVVTDVGTTWVLVRDDRVEHLVPLPAVVSVAGLGSAAAPPPGAVLRGLGLGHVLRALSRDRQVVRVLGGARTMLGRIDAVGADHLDLVGVYPDSGRPTGDSILVGFDALDVVSGT